MATSGCEHLVFRTDGVVAFGSRRCLAENNRWAGDAIRGIKLLWACAGSTGWLLPWGSVLVAAVVTARCFQALCGGPGGGSSQDLEFSCANVNFGKVTK